MEDYFSYVIYGIIVVLYFLFSGSSNKSKTPQNQKKQMPSPTKTQSMLSSQSEFDAYLKEIQQKKLKKENINPHIYQETYHLEEKSLENTKQIFKSLESTQSDLSNKPVRKKRKSFVQIEVSETNTQKNKKKQANEMIHFLKNKDTLKKVFIASEIFNKKF